MIKEIKQWFVKQNNITRKTAGLAEKEASTLLKLKVAMTILDRRQESIHVKFERRKNFHLGNGFKNGY